MTDTLKVVRALQVEGMPEAQAAIIATELYALYRVAVLGDKYKPVEYPPLDELREKIEKLKRAKTELHEKLEKLAAEKKP